MTQHSSLKAVSVGKRHRNVLKRHERIRTLKDLDTWGERHSVYKLPKQKLIKLKVRKAKSEKEGEAAAGEGTPAPQVQATGTPPQKASSEKPKGTEKSKA